MSREEMTTKNLGSEKVKGQVGNNFVVPQKWNPYQWVRKGNKQFNLHSNSSQKILNVESGSK